MAVWKSDTLVRKLVYEQDLLRDELHNVKERLQAVNTAIKDQDSTAGDDSASGRNRSVETLCLAPAVRVRELEQGIGAGRT